LVSGLAEISSRPSLRDQSLRDHRDVPQFGCTPLLYASQNGHLAVVGALLAKGADVQAKDNVSIARAFALCPSLRHIRYLQYKRARTSMYTHTHTHTYNTGPETRKDSVEGLSYVGVKECGAAAGWRRSWRGGDRYAKARMRHERGALLRRVMLCHYAYLGVLVQAGWTLESLIKCMHSCECASAHVYMRMKR
jgi:hypothetical protein